MSQENGTPEIQYKIFLKEPENVLKKQLGDDTIIVKFESEPFMQAGDNYGSTILKVNVIVKKNYDSREEELHLVAKMLPPTDFQRTMFESSFSFKKELFIYEELIPIYQKIYSKDFDFVPKFYGSRFSLDPHANEVDDDAVLLLENLKVKGFYMEDRLKGLDSEHLRMTVSNLAKFHAIGLSLKYKEPSFLPKLKKYSKALSIDQKTLRSFVEEVFDVIENDPEMGPNFHRVKALDKMEHLNNVCLQIILEPEDPWACVVHRDLWNNNVMFHRNDEGQLDDVKMMDFQTYCISSPMTDLIFLLTTSGQLPLSKYCDEMMEIYRQVAYDVTKELGCNPSMFSKENFEERLKIDAISELYHALIMTRVVTLGRGEDIDKTPVNQMRISRLRSIIELYVDKKWI